MDMVIVVVSLIVGFGAAMAGLHVGALAHYGLIGCQRCVRRFMPGPVRRVLTPLLELTR